MKLTIYKGFDPMFLEKLTIAPLVYGPIEEKKNVLLFDINYSKKLGIALLEMGDNSEAWISYEEYSIFKTSIDNAVEKYDLHLEIFYNNLFPDYYPISFNLNDNLVDEIKRVVNGENYTSVSQDCEKFIAVYNTLTTIDGVHYGSFYNYEYSLGENIKTADFYPTLVEIDETHQDCDFDIFLNEDIDTYLRDLARIKRNKPRTIGLKSTGGEASKRFQTSLQVYCGIEGIQLFKLHEPLLKSKDKEEEFKTIAREDLGISCFKKFRLIKFYKNPDIDKEVIEISQAQIIQEIVRQAEKSYDSNGFRDIFITASTGSGKSLMFQIPAVYLAKKYKKLTIVIEPVKALMQDQKEKLNSSGFNRVEAFNSDLISQVEKEAVLEKVKGGDVDLLYLSPETLLSYSIETIIGDREIGLLVVDEAHIVTTWGVGFRPDYWYLGGYLNRLRNQIQTSRGVKRKTYNFPICAFTATAINGGIDDSVSDTIISLYMENPIKYLGYVRRDNIGFDIIRKEVSRKLPKAEYEREKTNSLNERIQKWLKNEEKTIVYFPYASQVNDASKGFRGFADITTDERIGTYTGRNINNINIETFNESKRQVFERFKEGRTPIMLATKAFGLGIDVDDVKNVYHYAVTGNLCDYVQEIGRAARNPSMTGLAITDYYLNDSSFMKILFGMSQIRQYQIKQVLHGIYEIHKSKGYSRSFLISPESFTYIFNGRGWKDERECINKLKTSLLMLEKDFYDKYNFKVIISRPQSVFTKAFVCLRREKAEDVLNSKYCDCFNFIQKGRYLEKQADGSFLSDSGDIYSIDLKQVWEQFHPNISFPQFKYWYFNHNSKAKDKINIMPEIRSYFAPRQKVNIETRKDLLLCDLREKILTDFEYVADELYSVFKKQYFTTEKMANLISKNFGKANARLIANSLFDLVDPSGRCVKRRNNDATGRTEYMLAYGNLKEVMRSPIYKSQVIFNIAKISDASYSSYMCLSTDETSTIALKLLSIFNYITYEVVGGEEPEIFIRLNDPNKIKSIVLGNTFYSNNYVARAKQKHDRDVEILQRFFNDIHTDVDRWDFVEEYFLGYDVLNDTSLQNINHVEMSKAIDKERSHRISKDANWKDVVTFFDENDQIIINKIIDLNVKMPEYLETTIKKTDAGNDVIMCWPANEVLICQQEASDSVMRYFGNRGWNAYRIHEIDFESLKIKLELN